jgi:hypothetical protein
MYVVQRDGFHLAVQFGLAEAPRLSAGSATLSLAWSFVDRFANL